MIRFDTDDCLTGERPDSLPAAAWDAARDLTEESLHEQFITFFFGESAADLADGGPISEPVCCGGSLAAAVADSPLVPQRRELPGGGAVWAAPTRPCGYSLDLLLLPDAPWLPAELRLALEAACSREGDTDA